ncbi:MAG: ThuA domain-containing protein [Verrucomicrobiaceae bacterium]|nr:ThuA domain-containing protein [Verrucomicrobiaceae bacterium]
MIASHFSSSLCACLALLLVTLALPFTLLHAAGEWNPDVTYPPLSPAEAIKTIEVPKGYHLQCVASEPMVEEPMMFAFDGNGALYVCEWRTYMQDEHGTDQTKPVSRVVKLVDTDGDGVMDQRTVFIDNVVLPRAVLPLQDRVLVYFTGSSTIHAYFDNNHDGVADRHEVAWQGSDDTSNNEHQQSGLLWNLDNTICTNDRRLVWQDGKLSALPHTRSRISQYGLARDDDGRLFGSYGGGNNPAHSFQLPAGYPVLSVPEHAPDYNRTWGICPVWDESDGDFDVERRAVLKRFTAACGQTVLRSHLMPQWYGCAVTCEPVGRLLRMTRVEWKDGVGMAHNAFPGSEFIRSSDAYFRPVWTETGPDGAFYFADMYRGIIQEKTWFPTTLTEKHGDWRDEKLERWVARYERVKKWGMTKVVRHGRIYRLVPDDAPKQPAPKMLDESPEQLVAHLAHCSGWWRDSAQKLLVTRKDASVVPALTRMATEHASPDARIQALWTLQGLSALPREAIVAALAHEQPRVRRAAVQLAEPLLIKKDADIQQRLSAMAADPEAHVALQVFLAFRAAEQAGSIAMPTALLASTRKLPLVDLILKKDSADLLNNLGDAGKKGKLVYETLCIACHGPDGQGVRTADKVLAPSLVKSSWFADGGNIAVLARLLLKGQTGPIDGQTFGEGLMMPLEATHTDEQIANVLSYVGQQWHGWVSPANRREISRVRQAITDRKQPWTHDELVSWAKQREDQFHPIPFGGAATADGKQGVYLTQATEMDRVSIKRYGTTKVNGVPFTLPDPATSGGKNVIVLKGGAVPNAVCRTMPASVELPVNQAAGRLHLLGAVAGWGWPAMKEKEPLMTLTMHYQDGSNEVITLSNGIDIADHAGPIEVPGSASTGIVARGQMRYLWRDLSKPGQAVAKLTLASFGKRAAPLVAALTMEAPAPDGKLAPPPWIGGPAPIIDAPKAAEPKAAAGPLLPRQPTPGKHRVLLIGGGVSHDFVHLFDAHDRRILEANAPVITAYTSDPNTALAELPFADVTLLSANDPAYSGNLRFREALMQFVQRGGGLVLLHPATWYNWRGWPAYNQDFVGGGASKHEPHRDFQVHALKPQHPVLQGISSPFTIRDELYLVKLDARCEVLSEAVSTVTGAKYPSIWLTPHPTARIVSIALGHGKEAHEHADFAKTLGNAVKWSAEKAK